MAGPQRQIATLTASLGPVGARALKDPAVSELLLNPDGQLWLDHAMAGLVRAQDSSGALARLPAAQAEAFFADVAGEIGGRCDRHHPVLETPLPFEGSRLEALLPPVVPAPTFALRKRPQGKPYPLADYLRLPGRARGRKTPLAPVTAGGREALLQKAIGERRNVVVAGGVGTAKTSVLNTLMEILGQVAPHDRLVVLEDAPELQCPVANHVTLATVDELNIDLARLVRITLRLRPDRIVIGETRGPEALDLLAAWQVGSPGGLATVHADSAKEVIPRLEYLCRMAGRGDDHRQLIASAVDLVVFMARDPRDPQHGDLRAITEIAALHGLNDDGTYAVETLWEA